MQGLGAERFAPVCGQTAGFGPLDMRIFSLVSFPLHSALRAMTIVQTETRLHARVEQ